MSDSPTEDLTSTAPDETSVPSTENADAGGKLIDVVNAALGETEASPAPDKEPDSKESDSETTSGNDELSPEEKSQFSERAQRRFRELVEQRRSVEGEREQIRQELDVLKPKAERMDQLLGYMQTNNVAPEHLDNALQITAMINGGQFERVLPMLENLVNQVRAQAGDVLPKELQDQVRLGYITESHAKTLHKEKLRADRLEQQTRAQAERGEQERFQRETQAVVHRAATAADTWNKEQAASDPDWNLKREAVAEQIELELHRRGVQRYPRTDKEVRELCDTAKANVEKQVSRFKPAPKPIAPSPNGGSASPRSNKAPTSIMDVVDMALAKSA